jgi:hypothetical protein
MKFPANNLSSLILDELHMVPRGSNSVPFGISGTVPGSPSTCGLGTGNGVSGDGFEGLGEGGLWGGGGLGTGKGGGGLGLDTSMVSLHIRIVSSDYSSFATVFNVSSEIDHQKSWKLARGERSQLVPLKLTEIEPWQSVWQGARLICETRNLSTRSPACFSFSPHSPVLILWLPRWSILG